MIAAQQGSEEVVRKLLEYRPNISQTDKFGKKASDRATNQNICYLIQTATIDQRITKTKDSGAAKHSAKSPHALTSQRGGRKEDEGRKRQLPKEEATVLLYYRQKFMEQIALLSKKLSQKSTIQLEKIIQEELDKSETFLRGTVGSELDSLTDKMKEQIDHHVLLKTKLAAAKAGVAEGVEEELHEKQKEIKAHFPLSPPKRSPKQEKPPNTKADKKTINRLNRTIESLIESKEDLLHTKVGAFSPKDLPRGKQDMYIYLRKEILDFVGAKIDNIADSIAIENRENIAAILKEKVEALQKDIAIDLKRSMNDLGKTLKARIDNVVTEKVTRMQKQLKTQKDSEMKFAMTERTKMEMSRVDEASLKNLSKHMQLNELQNSIRQLDSSYTAMLDSGRVARSNYGGGNHDSKMSSFMRSEKGGRNVHTSERVRSLSNKSKGASHEQHQKEDMENAAKAGFDNKPEDQLAASQASGTSLPSGNQTDRIQEKPPRPKYYASMQRQAEEGHTAKVDYSKVEAHNTRVLPNTSKQSTPLPVPKDTPEELVPADALADPADSLREVNPKVLTPQYYIGDGSSSHLPADNAKLNSLMARYANVYQKTATEDSKGIISFAVQN